MFKRPMIFIVAAYALGIILYNKPVLCIVAFFSCLGICFYINECSKRSLLVIFVCPILIIIGCWHTTNMSKLPAIYNTFEDDLKIRAQGTIDSITQKENSVAVVIVDVIINEKYEVERVLAYFDKESNNLKIGGEISFSGEMSKFKHSTNPGQFDEFEYYVRQQREFFKVFVKDYSLCTNDKISDVKYIFNNSRLNIINKFYYMIKTLLYKVRVKFSNVFVNVFDDESGVVCAMLLGEKSLIDKEVKQLYMQNGISHILAISGLHLALVGAALYRLLIKTGINIYIGSGISIIVTLLYGIMTDFSTSTNRAVTMLIIMIIARCLGRTYDILTALAMSALIILISNPFLIFSAGFLLSFLAVIAISQINPMIISCLNIDNNVIKNKEYIIINENTGKLVDDRYLFGKYDVIDKIFNYVKMSLIAGISINIVTLPIVLNTYYEISIFSLILNIIVIPLMTVVIGMSIVVGFLGMFSLDFARIAGGCVYYILKFFKILCYIGANMDFLFLRTGKLPTYKTVIYVAGVICFAMVCYLKTKDSSHIFKGIKSKYMCIFIRWIRKIKFNPLIILSACLVVFIPKIFYEFQVTMLDVGQGQCIFVQMKDGTTLLYDCGSSDVKDVANYRVIPFLKYKGIKSIDYAIVSHMDSDHISGFEEIINNKSLVKIKKIVFPDINNKTQAYIDFEESVYKSNIRTIYMKEGSIIKGNEWNLECIMPFNNMSFKTENEYSCCIMLSYKDFNMLFTGDIEGDAEQYLADRLKKYNNSNKLKIDVLQVAHHGSKNSTIQEFVDVIEIDKAIISAGINNRYGHPNKETIDKLNKCSKDILVTSEKGAINIFFDGRCSYGK